MSLELLSFWFYTFFPLRNKSISILFASFDFIKNQFNHSKFFLRNKASFLLTRIPKLAAALVINRYWLLWNRCLYLCQPKVHFKSSFINNKSFEAFEVLFVYEMIRKVDERRKKNANRVCLFQSLLNTIICLFHNAYYLLNYLLISISSVDSNISTRQQVSRAIYTIQRVCLWDFNLSGFCCVSNESIIWKHFRWGFNFRE